MCSDLRHSKKSNKKVQLVLQQCYKTSWIAMLRALPPITNKVARYFLVGGKTRNIDIQLVLQQCCKSSCTFVVARFTAPSWWCAGACESEYPKWNEDGSIYEFGKKTPYSVNEACGFVLWTLSAIKRWHRKLGTKFVTHNSPIMQFLPIPWTAFPSLYRSIHFGDVSEANGRETDIFAWTTWPETLWPSGKLRPRD